MKLIKQIKIKFQVWKYIRNRNAKMRLLEKQKSEAVLEADRLFNIDGKRRYVLLLGEKYFILDNLTFNAINKTLPKGQKWDIVTVLRNCVYKTK